MTADLVFTLANTAALIGWLVLIWAAISQNAWLRDVVAGRWWPLTFAALYTVLILFFFGQSEGGFDTLANVQKLFTSPWAAVAGWVHYLAFDLFIGGWITRQVMTQGMSRLWLIALLPLTFLFGPMGLLAFEVVRRLSARATAATTGNQT
jgi:hypothetical protein